MKEQQEYRGADRLAGFDKPRVWSVLTPLSAELKASNLVLTGLHRDKDFPLGIPQSFISMLSRNKLIKVRIN